MAAAPQRDQSGQQRGGRRHAGIAGGIGERHRAERGGQRQRDGRGRANGKLPRRAEQRVDDTGKQITVEPGRHRHPGELRIGDRARYGVSGKRGPGEDVVTRGRPIVADVHGHQRARRPGLALTWVGADTSTCRLAANTTFYLSMKATARQPTHRAIWGTSRDGADVEYRKRSEEIQRSHGHHSHDVNGERRTTPAAPDTPLLYVLRNDFELSAAKFGCGFGQCGACTVIVDGEAVRSCITPVSAVAGKKIVTLRRVWADGQARLPLQRAFIAEQAAQCGYCVAGGFAELARRSSIRRSDPIRWRTSRAALAGNLCRCGTHNRIVRAVQRAAKERAV